VRCWSDPEETETSEEIEAVELVDVELSPDEFFFLLFMGLLLLLLALVLLPLLFFL